MIILMLFSAVLNAFVYYDIKSDMDVKSSVISSTVSVNLGDKKERLEFYLNNNLEIFSDYEIILKKREDLYNLYEIKRKDNKKFDSFKIYYKGVINYPLKEQKEEYQRSFRETNGIISEEGCYLSAQSYFYPVIKDLDVFRFKLALKIDRNYKTVTSGLKTDEFVSDDARTEIWESEGYAEDIPVSCGKYTEYKDKYNDISLYVFLRSPDKKLADKYLKYAKKYINIYSNLIGTYPYKKFALVENFFETGYGFASFTLIGPTVIRFPFLVVSSYPHEILHNWWGNGVFSDYEKGNWSEGLTAYLSDHLMAEQLGKGSAYRADTLKKYTDFVNEDNDIKLSEFKSRNSGASEAVGYGKSLMFFHALRKKVGDDIFIKSLKRFYKENLFKKASFSDLRNAFEKESKMDLKAFFYKYVDGKGLEKINISDVDFNAENSLYEIKFKITQTGDSLCDIPVFVFFKDKTYEEIKLRADKKEQIFDFSFSSYPIAVGLDLNYDLPRKINDGELPTTLTKINASTNPYIYIADDKYSNFLDIYKYRDYTILKKRDIDLAKLNSDIWVIGFDEEIFSKVSKDRVKYSNEYFVLDNTRYAIKDNSFVFSFDNPFNPSHTVNFLIPKDNSSTKNISFKIAHYSKYSYLVFDSNDTNVLSGVWKNIDSPNIVYKDLKIDLPYIRTKALVPFNFKINVGNIKKALFFLSSELKTRHPGSREIDKAADYVEKKFKENGLAGFFKNGYIQSFKDYINGKEYDFKNICGYLKGKTDKYVFITAHYDHLFPDNGKCFPGANDNSSGVSLVIALSDYFNKNKPNHNIVFCAFSGEEYGRIGSRYFLSNLSSDLLSKTIADINLDTIGRLTDFKIKILNSNSSSDWQRIFKNVSLSTMIDYQIINRQLDSSDQVSFIEKNIPSVQLFDGGDLLYHKHSDTYDTLNFEGIGLFGEFAVSLIEELDKYDSIEYLKPDMQNLSAKRKVSLGFMPDFSYSGKGVRVSKISENSLISASPIKEGDVILKINGKDIDNLITYSNVLSQVGESISIEYISNNEIKNTVINIKK
ncbi:MAG TPA: M28 family peptidase [Elusimicrobiales bacterium]|nr:M28 family peptidase [Elusimicrobiales bacterium]HPO95025.1 M28 family peptidase [Elusimicrobiales bacterium]